MRNYLVAWLLACSTIGCGSEGPKGDPGPSGTGLTISSGFICSKASLGYVFKYSAVIYSTGDAWVTCQIADTAFQVSASQVYKANQTGATSLSCITVFDIDSTQNYGYWSFSGSSGKKAVYSDSGAYNGTTVSFASSDCNEY